MGLCAIRTQQRPSVAQYSSPPSAYVSSVHSTAYTYFECLYAAAELTPGNDQVTAANSNASKEKTEVADLLSRCFRAKLVLKSWSVQQHAPSRSPIIKRQTVTSLASFSRRRGWSRPSSGASSTATVMQSSLTRYTRPPTKASPLLSDLLGRTSTTSWGENL